jgi:hypothetical protein
MGEILVRLDSSRLQCYTTVPQPADQRWDILDAMFLLDFVVHVEYTPATFERGGSQRSASALSLTYHPPRLHCGCSGASHFAL